MESSRQKLTDNWRLFALAVVFFTGIVFLACRLYNVQVVRAANFSADFVRQSIRRVQMPGLRGRVFDRNGEILADNRASNCIVYYVEELRKRGKWIRTIDAVNESIDRMAEVLALPRMVTREAVSNHVMQSLPMPLIAWRDVSQETLARWAVNAEAFPGTDIYEQPERRYPHGSLANHVLGYVRRDRPQPRPGEKYHFYLPEMVGRAGIEAQFNGELTGTAGLQLIRVDARGYKDKKWNDEPSISGKDVYLSIDARIQEALEQALAKENRVGAGVVIDPRNGDVLAMASAPAYDPNRFVPFLSTGLWRSLNEDPGIPLLNRAIQGRYAPGSTFKTITSIAALMAGFPEDTVYDCVGVFTLGTMRLRCWDGYGHGPISLRKAIEQSCNAYFCNMGYTIGYEAIRKAAEAAGLGRKTGISLPGESAGVLPSPEWKEKTLHQRWMPGDTCHASIGQGLLLATPLQMAVAAGIFANGGKRMTPRLRLEAPVKWDPDSLDGKRPEGEATGWPREMVETVRAGMRDVVMAGSGRRVQVEGLEIAAKTGTAEFDVRGERHKNTWVIAFAPYDREASLALAIVVENGESGGLTAAPIAHDVFATAFAGRTEAFPPAEGGVPE